MMDTTYHMDFDGFLDPDKDRAILLTASGSYRTNIFYEFNTANHEDVPPVYTMREKPYAGYPSAYLIYMHAENEYEAAIKLVGSWQHWEKLLKSKIFMNGSKNNMQWTGLLAWRREKEIKEQAAAYNQLKINAATGNVQAQKLIYEGKKVGSTKGRPSKEQVQKAAEKQASIAQEVRDNLTELKLAVKNGKKVNS